MLDEHPLAREERLQAEAELELMYGKKEAFEGDFFDY